MADKKRKPHKKFVIPRLDQLQEINVITEKDLKKNGNRIQVRDKDHNLVWVTVPGLE